MQDLAQEAHEIMFWLLALLIAAHVGAAFYHHLFLRDATLTRMLPWSRLRADNTAVTTTTQQDSDHAA